MAVELFTGNVIAVIWDFDKTLIPNYQQDPLFEEYKIDSEKFWAEVSALTSRYEAQGIVVSKDTLYLNHLLTYVQAGILADLTNAKLRELGSRLTFYEGIPDFLQASKQEIENDETYEKHGITVEHYVVSTGLRQMILGSAAASYLRGVWACEFIEDPAEPGFLEAAGPPPAKSEDPGTPPVTISQVGYFLDNTTKTRAIWEINKGVNDDPTIDVNAYMPQEDRRVPLRNMIYIADGASDVPVFSILNANKGATLGVYNPGSDKHFEEVRRLSDQGRVNVIAPADYRPGALASKWLLSTMRKIADMIVHNRSLLLSERVLPPTGHVNDPKKDA